MAERCRVFENRTERRVCFEEANRTLLGIVPVRRGLIYRRLWEGSEPQNVTGRAKATGRTARFV